MLSINIELKRYLFLLFFCLTHLTCVSQSSFTKKLDNYIYLTHSEKLYVATDRETYTASDTLWLSAWLLNADDLSPEPLEKIMYVDLLDQDGNVHYHHLFHVDSGRSRGQIELGSDLIPGIYQLVAYTNYMKNQGTDFFFKKLLLILGQIQVNAADETTMENLLDNRQTLNHISDTLSKSSLLIKESNLKVSFLPEGGNLVENIPCRIAFIGEQEGATSVSFSGIVYDDQNNIVVEFKSEFNGKGVLMLISQPNTTYHAIIKDDYGLKKTIPLPLAAPNGHTMTIPNALNNPSKIDVIINSSPSTLNRDSISLVITQHHEVAKTYKFLPDKSTTLISIPTNMLKTGIVQITLFDSKNTPLCERLTFVNNNDVLDFFVSTQSINDSLVDIMLTIKDKNGHPVSGSFAMAIIKNKANDLDTLLNNRDIVTYLYLYSELPGLEPDCDYFFYNDRKSAWQRELTLLTNGWSRYSWQEVLADSIPDPQFSLDQKLYIAGNVTQQISGNPVKKAKISINGRGKGFIASSDVKTNDKGNFVFDIDDFYDSMNITIVTANRKNNNRNYTIDLKTNLSENKTNKFYSERLGIQPSNTFKDSILIDLSQINSKKIPNNPYKVSVFVDEPYLNDTADITLQEVEIKGKPQLSPSERIHATYGPNSITIGEKQLVAINQNVKWNTGLFSTLAYIIPGLETSIKANVARNSFGLGAEYRPKMAGGSSGCPNYEEIEGSSNDPDRYAFTYNGTGYFRLFIYVDGQLCAFSNDAGQIDWVKTHLSELDLYEIESVGFIEKPKMSALGDAMSAHKYGDEIYSSTDNIIYYCPSPEHIITIKTKTGQGLFSDFYTKGAVNMNLVGFVRTREFYTPINNSSVAQLLNHRPTIYWNPTIETNDLGMTSFSLNKEWLNQQYCLKITGISDNSVPGYYQYQNTDIEALLQKSETSDLKSTSSIEPISTVTQLNDSLKEITIFTSNSENGRFASIRTNNGCLIQQTALDGNIVIDSNKLFESDTICISIPGWGDENLTFKELLQSSYQIDVPYGITNIEDTIDIEKIIKRMLRNMVKNRPINIYDLNGVFCQQQFLNNELIQLMEFDFIQRKMRPEYSITSHTNMIDKVVQMQCQNYSQKVPFQFLNQKSDFLPNIDPLDMDLGFLKWEVLNRYTIKYRGKQIFNGRKSLILTFEPTSDPVAIYSGMLIVDEETYAVAHVQWYVKSQKRDLVTAGNYLAPNKQDFVFKLISDMHHATYTINSEKWTLQDASQQLIFSYNNKTYSLQNELAITDNLERRTKKYRSTKPEKLTPTRNVVKEVNYSPQEWRSDRVLLPDAKLQEQVKGLYELVIYDGR
ncbi:MAG: hypothetical protein JW717_12535 [Marinilabiliaceae bacterium]|nr:hypothetical protein [Marinilabiliaceae bacterium]